MSQHYPKPADVVVPWATSAYSVRKLKQIIAKDGLIAPILVTYKPFPGNDDEMTFMAADQWQAERVVACRELKFETILVETEWTEEDL